MSDESDSLAQLLSSAGRGDPRAARELLPLVYGQLRRAAQRQLRGERPDHSLQATELVHEAFLRLERSQPEGWDGKAHFYVAAAEAMRRILIEHARKRGRRKRGGDRRKVPLDAVSLAEEARPEEILSVEAAIRRLEERDERMARIVRLRFFVGLGIDEIAELEGLSDRTVRRDWTFARAWLQKELAPPVGDGEEE